jgi:hypothetical protein
MAQYTTALASEYNDIQNKVQDILGARQGIPSTYGYNNAGLITSSNVSKGQQIKKDEWDKLKVDINTLWYYQYNTTNSGCIDVVTGSQIMWSNVVSYQSAINTLDDRATNHNTYTSTGSFGQTTYPHFSSNSLHYDYAAGWGGADAGQKTDIRLNGTSTWPSRQELQAYFNAGGFFRLTPNFSGGTITTTGTKDYALSSLGSLCYQNWTWYDWWTHGGSDGTNKSTSIAVSAVGQGYTPYNTAGNIVCQSTITYDGNATISWSFRAIDGDTGTTSDGVTPAPAFGATTSIYIGGATAGGYTAPTGVGVVSITNPTPSGSWTAY